MADVQAPGAEPPPVVRTNIAPPLDDRQGEALTAVENALFFAASTGVESAFDMLIKVALNSVGDLTLREALTCAETLARQWAATGSVQGRVTLAHVLMMRASELKAEFPERAYRYRWMGIAEQLELANEGVPLAGENLLCDLTLMADDGDEDAAELLNHLAVQFPAAVAAAADEDVREWREVEARQNAEANK